MSVRYCSDLKSVFLKVSSESICLFSARVTLPICFLLVTQGRYYCASTVHCTLEKPKQGTVSTLCFYQFITNYNRKPQIL